MPSFTRMQWLATATGTMLAAGLFFLLVDCIAEAVANPGFSLVDGYWRGRLPWMGIAEGWIVSAATASAVTGFVTTVVSGGWVRRIAVVPLTLVALAWWLLALMPPRRGVPCEVCPASPLDPWAYAYSLPESTALFLIVPAFLITAIALTARPNRVSAS